MSVFQRIFNCVCHRWFFFMTMGLGGVRVVRIVVGGEFGRECGAGFINLPLIASRNDFMGTWRVIYFKAHFDF